MRPFGRLARRTRLAYRALLVAGLSVFLFHAAFHLLADGLQEGYDNPLGAIWGPGTHGLVAHALEVVVVASALTAALLGSRQPREDDFEDRFKDTTGDPGAARPEAAGVAGEWEE